MPKSPPIWLAEMTHDLEVGLEDLHSPIAQLRVRVEQDLEQQIESSEFAAQATHTLLLLEHFDTFEERRLSKPGVLRRWLQQQQALPWPLILQCFDRWRASRSSPPRSSRRNSARNWDDYGPFLKEYDPNRRHKRGVFYTPAPIAEFMIAQTDRMLRDEWCEVDGVAALRRSDCHWFVTDPAAGSAVFLTALLTRIATGWEPSRVGVGGAERIAFSDWLAPALKRISGRDILLPACVLAHLRIAVELERCGYDLERLTQIDVALGDSLRASSWEDDSARRPIIVGNPPFSGLSQNHGGEIDSLMRCSQRGYYSIDGVALRERKLWLNDDYVKFIRMAQHRIESAGQGIAALVTNHAMIDNATFRGMRWSLQQTFQRHSILDLHGNRKRGERDLENRPDENLFAIDQGVALCFLRRGGCATEFVEHADLWGAREEKFAALREAIQDPQPRFSATRFQPANPHYLYSPSQASVRFRLGLPLPELFPVNTSAPVTARDRLVVAHSESELLSRMATLRDLSISEDQIRRQFFSRKASTLQRPGRRKTEYPPGDTRGWRLADARRKLAADEAWQSHTKLCLYRPFDWRSIYWTRDMIDWPRMNVSRHFQDGQNLVLIARRLSPPNSAGSYLWASSGLAVDGVIRSDNRGSETLFPLFLQGRDEPENLDPKWVKQCAANCGMEFVGGSRGDLRSTFNARDVAAYLYAQLQAPAYQRRFRDDLRQEFPRAFLPRSEREFVTLARLGRRLLDWHLTNPALRLKDPDADAGETTAAIQPSHSSTRDSSTYEDVERSRDRRFKPLHLTMAESQVSLRPPYPRWSANCIELDAAHAIPNVSEEVWQFRVGSHQICSKWLKDRCNRLITTADLRFFDHILTAIEATLRIRDALPGDVDSEGQWTFLPNS